MLRDVSRYHTDMNLNKPIKYPPPLKNVISVAISEWVGAPRKERYVLTESHIYKNIVRIELYPLVTNRVNIESKALFGVFILKSPKKSFTQPEEFLLSQFFASSFLL